MTPTADDDSPHPRWGESSASGDPGTDPGRPHPYESLYRGGAPGSRGDGRPTPRHYIPSIARPDGVESGYGWLYRDPEPEVPVRPGAAEQPPLPPELALASEPEAPVRRPRRALRIVALIVLLALLVSGAAGLLIQRRAADAGGRANGQPNIETIALSLPADSRDAVLTAEVTLAAPA